MHVCLCKILAESVKVKACSIRSNVGNLQWTSCMRVIAFSNRNSKKNLDPRGLVVLATTGSVKSIGKVMVGKSVEVWERFLNIFFEQDSSGSRQEIGRPGFDS